MPHVLSFVHALKISWIKRVLDPDNYAPWKVLWTDVLEDLGQDKFWYKNLLYEYFIEEFYNSLANTQKQDMFIAYLI
jgi:hypothetical protein